MIIGITGNISSGKSEVANMFKTAGYTVFHADTMAHELYAKNPDLVDQIEERFGGGVLYEDGTLNRSALGHIVFGDPNALEELNAIVHPALIQYIEQTLFSCSSEKVVLDAALIIEWGVVKLFDVLIVVTCNDDVRCERLMRRNELSEFEAMERIRSQMSQYEKVPHADYAIENHGTIDELRAEVEGILDDISRSAGFGSGRID